MISQKPLLPDSGRRCFLALLLGIVLKKWGSASVSSWPAQNQSCSVKSQRSVKLLKRVIFSDYMPLMAAVSTLQIISK